MKNNFRKKQKLTQSVEVILKNGAPSDLPENIEPMLATLTSDPVEGGEWVYEMKWDGYRAI
ncbi:MAG TPA: hypothetical protein VEZ55_08100, partial [Chitinophagaceae bacterium]|nr:hypothetical protein [Chitinophagaceae bacterium]